MQPVMLDSCSSLSFAAHKNPEEQKTAMDEDDNISQPALTNPANDNLARVFRWIGLLCGLAMLGWTAVLLR
jgi:hypothetical protein